jgi:hypothetical protein
MQTVCEPIDAVDTKSLKTPVAARLERRPRKSSKESRWIVRWCISG